MTTDASGFAIGGILSQGKIGKDKPIAYTSSIEINLIKQGNAKCISSVEGENKVPQTNLTCNEEINYDIIEKRKIDESNSKETKELMNGENFIKNKNNRRNYDELKYKVIEDGNIDNDNIGGNEQILINDGNLIKNMKDKEYNDVYVEKIDINDTEKIKQLLNEEYLLKNDYENDEKCCMESDFEDIKKGTIYGNNEKTIEQLGEENLFNIINKRLINIIKNKMKNEGNGNAFYKLINEENISETFVFQFLKGVIDLIPILLENENKRYAMQTISQLKNSRNISMDKNKDNIKNK